MILLDTDHLSVLRGDPSDRQTRLSARLAAVTDEVVGTTIVTFEEQMRGWIASFSRERQAHRQIRPYYELTRLIEFFADYHLAPFDAPAAQLFARSIASGSEPLIGKSPPSPVPRTPCS